MKSVFKKSKSTPKNIQSDQGKEFFNSTFRKLMDKFDINHYHTYTHLKASICERFNRTLKNRMWKMFSMQGKYKWIHNINYLVNQYNNSYHRTIKMKPIDVCTKNEEFILKSVYNIPKIFPKHKFLVGDFVRISKYKGAFMKGYKPNWSTENTKKEKYSSACKMERFRFQPQLMDICK